MTAMRSLPLALAAALLLSACSARTRRFVGYQFAGKAPAAACHEDGPARWCVYEPPYAAEDGAVVYFLHYATGDERSFHRLGLSRAFYDEYRRAGKPAPRVVTVSYGTHWLLTRAPGVRQTVTLDDFAALRARIEKRIGPVTRRAVWGMSMGGYNAAVAALSAPADWAAIALSCPALEAASPYADPGPSPFARALEGRQLFTHRLSDEAAWKSENPLTLVSAAGAPPLLIEDNSDDEFGFRDGARALATAYAAAGHAVERRESTGGHCAIDARLAARWLAAQETATASAGAAAKTPATRTP